MNMDRKCLELSKTLDDPTITEAACIAFQRFNPPKCRECEWGDNEKAPLFLPEIIAKDSPNSTITPKEVQSSAPETPETILGHSGKPKAKIEGFCQRRNENLVWNACLQRKYRGISLCESCDPNKEFIFSEQPMGQGWHNSAKRAGEMECPELDGRKLKKSTCIMRQGKKRKMGKSCDCEYWKGEKMEKPSALRTLITMWCSTCQAERLGWINQKTHCGECETELQERQPANQVFTPTKLTYMCADCHSNQVEAPDLVCNVCFNARWDKAALVRDNLESIEPQPGPKPLTYFCPTAYCANPVEVEGMLCGNCQVEKLKEVNPLQPDNSYERHILSTETVKPNHVKVIGMSSTLCDLLYRHAELAMQRAELDEEIRTTADGIVAELQTAVKKEEDRS